MSILEIYSDSALDSGFYVTLVLYSRGVLETRRIFVASRIETSCYVFLYKTVQESLGPIPSQSFLELTYSQVKHENHAMREPRRKETGNKRHLN